MHCISAATIERMLKPSEQRARAQKGTIAIAWHYINARKYAFARFVFIEFARKSIFIL